MLFNLFNLLFGNLTFFSGAYSNNVFPDPLSKEEISDSADKKTQK